MDKLSQVTPYVIDVNAPLVLRMPITKLMEGDNGANTLRVQMMDGDAPANLSGYTAVGEVRREDGKRVTFACTISGNVITGTLNADCYAYPGDCIATIQLAKTDGFRRTVLMIGSTVTDKGDGEIIDGGNVIEDVAGVIAMLDEMRAVTADTKEAAQTALDSAAQADAAREGIEGELDKKAPAIEAEASGALVTADDAAAMRAAQLISHIEPVQAGEGDPSPDNVRPISGWDAASVVRTGRNLYGGGDFVGTAYKHYVFPTPLKAGTYTISAHVTSTDTDTTVSAIRLGGKSNKQLAYLPFERGVNSNKTITVNEDIYNIRFSAGTSIDNSAGDSCEWKNIMVNVGEVEKPHEAYRAEILTTDLPETIYGGTLDWTTGILTVNRGFITLDGSENYSTSWDKNCYSTADKLPGLENAMQAYEPDCMCSHAIKQSSAYMKNRFYVKYNRLHFNFDDQIGGVDAFKTWLAAQYAAGTPVQAAYMLETPYTIQLSPRQLDMLKGYNNVWSDTGDTSLVYVADTKMYIDNQIAAAVALALGN